MKIKLIAWLAVWKYARNPSDKKFPHYALVLNENGDKANVLFFTATGQMVLDEISQSATAYAEIAKIDVPEKVMTLVKQYVESNSMLHDFRAEFLSHVEKNRSLFEGGSDILDKLESGEPVDTVDDNKDYKFPPVIIEGFMMEPVYDEQPFPRLKAP